MLAHREIPHPGPTRYPLGGTDLMGPRQALVADGARADSPVNAHVHREIADSKLANQERPRRRREVPA